MILVIYILRSLNTVQIQTTVSIVFESENIDNENQILSTPQKDSSKKYLFIYC